jgi:hypothetical protein
LLWLFCRWRLVYYLLRLALNCHPPDLSLPSNYNYRREPLAPGKGEVLKVTDKQEDDTLYLDPNWSESSRVVWGISGRGASGQVPTLLLPDGAALVVLLNLCESRAARV